MIHNPGSDRGEGSYRCEQNVILHSQQPPLACHFTFCIEPGPFPPRIPLPYQPLLHSQLISMSEETLHAPKMRKPDTNETKGTASTDSLDKNPNIVVKAPRPRWVLHIQAQFWRYLMGIGMFLHKFASPRPMKPKVSAARTISIALLGTNVACNSLNA